MKKILLKSLVILILASTVLSLVSCGGDKSAPMGMITASGESADYYFFVPEDWTVDLSTKASGAYFSESDPSSVSVTSWELENTDTTLDEWWAINLADIELVFENVTVTSEKNTTLDGLYAKEYVYTASLGENNYKIAQTAVIKNSVVYVFTYTSTVESYDAHTADVAKMTENIIIK